jgi:hypothetical protein
MHPCLPNSFMSSRADNDLNKLEIDRLRLVSTINSLNLVYEPNKSNLNSKLSLLNKQVELELCIV